MTALDSFVKTVASKSWLTTKASSQHVVYAGMHKLPCFVFNWTHFYNFHNIVLFTFNKFFTKLCYLNNKLFLQTFSEELNKFILRINEIMSDLPYTRPHLLVLKSSLYRENLRGVK